MGRYLKETNIQTHYSCDSVFLTQICVRTYIHTYVSTVGQPAILLTLTTFQGHHAGRGRGTTHLCNGGGGGALYTHMKWGRSTTHMQWGEGHRTHTHVQLTVLTHPCFCTDVRRVFPSHNSSPSLSNTSTLSPFFTVSPPLPSAGMYSSVTMYWKCVREGGSIG